VDVVTTVCSRPHDAAETWCALKDATAAGFTLYVVTIIEIYSVKPAP
jgi:hypothetical protein